MFRFISISILALVGALVGLWTPDLELTALEEKYSTSATRFSVVNGNRIHYRDSGPRDAPVLVMLHGFGSSLQTWQAWSDVLDKKFRVIRLDLPGFGLTGSTRTQQYADTDDVQFLSDFVDHLGLHKFALVGHSMGGRIAWNFAAAYPDRVKLLVLMAPDGYANTGDFGSKPYASSVFVRVIEYCLPRYLVKKSLEPALFDANALTEDVLTRYYEMLRAPGVRKAIVERSYQTVDTDPVERLKKITAPTLLLWGAEDRMIPKENAVRYELALGHVQTVILPGQGHLIQEERPQEGVEKLLAFLSLQAGMGMRLGVAHTAP